MAEDLDIQNTSDIDTDYVRGIVQVYRGTIHLSLCEFESAIEYFSTGQRLFAAAKARREEAISFLALGIVYQQQRELGAEPEALTTGLTMLQCSLSLLRELEDNLRFDARDRLASIRELLEKVADTKKPPAPFPTLWLPAPQVQGKKIPIVARIAAGEAILAEENIEDYADVEDEIADRVDFGLRVKGDSMIGAAILDGDIILMKKTEDPPPNGQIVAVIINQMDPEATLKRFYRERDHVRLEPANDSYPLIIVKPNSLSEAEIRERYKKTHPKRLLEIYSGEEPQIAGWARALIRKEIK